MAFDGSGTYTPPAPQYPVISGTIIYASDFNTIISDIATALSNCITKDGQQAIIANIPMRGFRFTGLGAGAEAGDSVSWDQVFSPGATFNAPVLSGSPASGDNSLKVATTAWVQTRITQPIVAADVIPDSDYGQRLATTKFVTDKLLGGSVSLPAINLHVFDTQS